MAEITNVLASTDADDLKRARIEEILGNEATATGRLGVAQLQDSVGRDLASLGIDAESVDMLTLSQLGQIENVMAGSDTNDVKKMRVEEIIGGEATATGRLGVAQLQDSVAADLASLGIDAECRREPDAVAARADRERDGRRAKAPKSRRSGSTGSSPN